MFQISSVIIQGAINMPLAMISIGSERYFYKKLSCIIIFLYLHGKLQNLCNTGTKLSF